MGDRWFKPSRTTSWVLLVTLAGCFFNGLVLPHLVDPYIPPPEPSAKMKWALDLPYRVYPDKFVYTIKVPPAILSLSDENKAAILIYEDDKPLPHPHAVDWEIVDYGEGRYNLGPTHFVVSTSDNIDALKARRRYWAVLPDAVD